MRFAYCASDSAATAPAGEPGPLLPHRLLGSSDTTSHALELPALAVPDFAWESGSRWQWSAVSVPCGRGAVRAVSERLYRRLLESLGERHLYRIWNFVPRINRTDGALETYRHFSYGRSVAFEAAFASKWERRMPAASAVGSPGEELVVIALVGSEPPQLVENPLQVPAYRYPRRYGPRAPSFARGALARQAGEAWFFISGTAAIRGSESLHAGDVVRQTAVTLENLAIVASEAEVPWGEVPPGARRFFRVYLRHGEDLALVRAQLEADLLRPGDRVEYLQAEICRAELAVEIEATLSLPT